jgi:uncharacterized protein with ATP-grasp and redox domains
MTELELTNDQILTAVKYYNNIKKHQYKYNRTEGGLNKRAEATRRYYNKNKADPEFRKKQCEKVKEYQKNNKDLINLKRREATLARQALKKMNEGIITITEPIETLI